jgi:peptidyl-prolyl cis-trans isomerase D
MRGQVEARVRSVKGGELAKKKGEDLLASLAKNGPTPVGAVETGLFGYDEKGVVPRIGTSKELMDAAFTLTKSAPLPKAPIAVDGRWVVVKLSERVEADKGEFEKQKEAIKKELLPKKQEEALDSWVKELRAKARIEINEALISY